MPIPQKILSRKDEITAAFLQIAEAHIQDLLANRATARYHAKDFAAQLFIHPVHLTNTLHLTKGWSPCDFMEQRIMEEACKLLRDNELSIADIGAKFAYYDPTNFTKFFKGMCGMTPLQFRKSKLQFDDLTI